MKLKFTGGEARVEVIHDIPDADIMERYLKYCAKHKFDFLDDETFEQFIWDTSSLDEYDCDVVSVEWFNAELEGRPEVRDALKTVGFVFGYDGEVVERRQNCKGQLSLLQDTVKGVDNTTLTVVT